MTDTSAEPALRTVLDQHRFLEAPRWHDRRIWVSDIYAQLVWSAAGDGTDKRIEARLPGLPSGTGFLPDGRLLIALMEDHVVLRREPTGELVEHAQTLPEHGNLNDMVVDTSGRAYVGTVGFNPVAKEPFATGYLEMIEPDGTVTTVADGLWFPNGSVITDDNQLLVCESFGNRVTAYDLSTDGAASNRREWATFGAAPQTTVIADFLPALDVTPDGCCLDEQGALWVADPEHFRVLRVLEGTVLQTIDADVEVFACMLGGPTGTTLYLCLAPDSSPIKRMAAPESRLMAVEVEHARAGRP